MTSNRPQTLRPDQARCLGLSGKDRFCEGLRMPAPGVRRAAIIGPPSANLHNSGLTLARIAKAGAVVPVSVPFLVHRQSGCGPDRHIASLAPSCLARGVIWVSAAVRSSPQIGRRELSEAEPQSDRGSD